MVLCQLWKYSNQNCSTCVRSKLSLTCLHVSIQSVSIVDRTHSGSIMNGTLVAQLNILITAYCRLPVCKLCSHLVYIKVIISRYFCFVKSWNVNDTCLFCLWLMGFSVKCKMCTAILQTIYDNVTLYYIRFQ